jgi:hypothetical protein
MHAYLVPGQVRLLYCPQHHAQQRLLLLGPQALKRAALEAAKHTEVKVTVCQACRHTAWRHTPSMSHSWDALHAHMHAWWWVEGSC